MSKAAILLACLARAAGDAPALLGRPADTSLKSVPRFPGPAATECFAGEVAGRAYAEGSGHALVNFSAFVTFRAEGCKVRQRSDSFLSSGAYDELERLAAQRPVSPEMREAERRLHAARRSGSRADWGLSVTPDGKALLFGVGRRDFRHSTSPGTPLGAARGRVDGTLRAPKSLGTFFDGHWHDVLVARVVAGAASTLYVYVDGELAASGPGGRAVAFEPSAADRRNFDFDGGSGVAALYDAPARVPVAEAHGSGFFADVLRRAAPDKRVQAEYPVYYSAHTDPGSRHMADLFLASLERNGNGARVPEGTYAAITELDVRFFAGAPIADLVDDALERCGDGCDGVFQREDDTSLHRNLGFMVIKVDRRVKKLFEHVGLAAATSGRVRGAVHRGPNFPAVKAIKAPTDQMVLNVALWEPEKLFTLDDAFVAGAARPILRTTVFPAAEVATRAFLLQLALRYKHKGAFALYHVNDFGGISSPDKARDAKMAELDVIERAVYNARRAGEEECNATAAERAGIVASYLVGPRPKKRKLPKKKHVTLDLKRVRHSGRVNSISACAKGMRAEVPDTERALPTGWNAWTGAKAAATKRIALSIVVNLRGAERF
ncbi:hypothetical protein JL721_5008 [Aureococcus anophagefferens]|nr:hypothetical protein JL721_5008 [Aureococcus anophagefferens]